MNKVSDFWSKFKLQILSIKFVAWISSFSKWHKILSPFFIFKWIFSKIDTLIPELCFLNVDKPWILIPSNSISDFSELNLHFFKCFNKYLIRTFLPVEIMLHEFKIPVERYIEIKRL